MRLRSKLGQLLNERRFGHAKRRPSIAKIAEQTIRAAGTDSNNRRVLAVGDRVGGVKLVRPNYHPVPCQRCTQPVWVNGELLLSFDVTAVCTVCLIAPDEPSAISKEAL